MSGSAGDSFLLTFLRDNTLLGISRGERELQDRKKKSVAREPSLPRRSTLSSLCTKRRARELPNGRQWESRRVNDHNRVCRDQSRGISSGSPFIQILDFSNGVYADLCTSQGVSSGWAGVGTAHLLALAAELCCLLVLRTLLGNPSLCRYR